MKRYALILALVLLLCGCTKTPPQTTTPIAETIEPTETTPPEKIQVDVSDYEALLSYSADPNWLARSLGCLYEFPTEVDLNFMFYLGVDHPGSWNEISAESRQKLLDAGFMADMDLQIMPVEKLEAALQTAFGVALADMTIPEEWCYIEAEDSWCSNHNDAFFPGVPTITAVEDDGVNIRIHYNIEGYFNLETEEFLDCAELVLCLERLENGTIHAVSNIIAH